MLPLHDHAATPVNQLEFLRATFGRFSALGQLLEWGRDLDPPVRVEEIIAQDEYSHDVLVPLPGARYLAFDAT